MLGKYGNFIVCNDGKNITNTKTMVLSSKRKNDIADLIFNFLQISFLRFVSNMFRFSFQVGYTSKKLRTPELFTVTNGQQFSCQVFRALRTAK
jgi:hypothetical protein